MARRTVLAVPAAVAVLAVLAAGCTDGAEPPSPASTTTATTSAAETSGPDGATSSGPTVCDPGKYADLNRALSGPAVHTLIFVDRSSSAVDTSTVGFYAAKTREALTRQFVTRGSEVDLFLVHDRTTSKAHHAHASLDVPAPERVDTDLKQKTACDQAHNALVAHIAQGAVGALRFVRTQSVGAGNADGTDLWGVLEVASDAFGGDPAGTERRVLVYSDMLECMRGARCFERTPPGSRAQAEAWGAEDAARIEREYRIDKGVLAGASYTLVTGAHGLRDEAAHVPYYWRALLTTLGASDDRIEVVG